MDAHRRAEGLNMVGRFMKGVGQVHSQTAFSLILVNWVKQGKTHFIKNTKSHAREIKNTLKVTYLPCKFFKKRKPCDKILMTKHVWRSLMMSIRCN